MACEVVEPGAFKGLHDLETRAYSTRHLVIKDLDELVNQNSGHVVKNYELTENFQTLSKYLAGVMLVEAQEFERGRRTASIANGMKLGFLVAAKLIHTDEVTVSMEPFSQKADDTEQLDDFIRSAPSEYLKPRENLTRLYYRYTSGFTTTREEQRDARITYGLSLLLTDIHIQTEYVQGLLDNTLEEELKKW